MQPEREGRKYRNSEKLNKDRHAHVDLPISPTESIVDGDTCSPSWKGPLRESPFLSRSHSTDDADFKDDFSTLYRSIGQALSIDAGPKPIVLPEGPNGGKTQVRRKTRKRTTSKATSKASTIPAVKVPSILNDILETGSEEVNEDGRLGLKASNSPRPRPPPRSSANEERRYLPRKSASLNEDAFELLMLSPESPENGRAKKRGSLKDGNHISATLDMIQSPHRQRPSVRANDEDGVESIGRESVPAPFSLRRLSTRRNSLNAEDEEEHDPFHVNETVTTLTRAKSLDEREFEVAHKRTRYFDNLVAGNEKSVRESMTSPSLFGFETLLLFAGVKAPKGGCFNPWWVTYIGWRFLVFVSLIVGLYNIGVYFHRRLWEACFSYVIPMVLSTLAAGAGYLWLPGVVFELREAGVANLTPSEARASLFVAMLYIAVWLVTGLLVTAAVAASTGEVVAVIAVFFLSSSTTPVLGAVLLALSFEMALARGKVKVLAEACREKRLTRADYLAVSSYVQKRSLRWQLHLNALASIAVYCTLGLVVLLRFGVSLVRSGGEDDDDEFDDDGSGGGANGVGGSVEYVFYLFAVLGKETCLFFFLLFLVMGVNDDADSIISELIKEPWGELGSAEEAGRLDLLFLATTFAVKPEAVVSWWGFMTTPRTRPISFRVCTLRITRDFFLAASLSAAVTFSNVILRAAI